MLSLLTLDIVHASMTLCSLNRNLDWLALEALLEQVAIAPVLSIIVIDITASNALDSLSHRLFSLAYEQVKMVDVRRPPSHLGKSSELVCARFGVGYDMRQ